MHKRSQWQQSRPLVRIPRSPGAGEVQEEAQVFLHEPLRQVQSSWKKTLETDAADHQNSCGHHTGIMTGGNYSQNVGLYRINW